MSTYEKEVLDAIEIYTKMKQEDKQIAKHLDAEIKRLCDSLSYVKQKGFFRTQENENDPTDHR